MENALVLAGTEQALDRITALRVSDLAPHSGVILVTDENAMASTNTDTSAGRA